MSVRGVLTCSTDGSAFSTNTSTVTFGLPSGCQAGDRVFYTSVTNTTGNTVTLPSGHVLLSGPDSPQASNVSILATGVLTATDVTAGSFSITWASSGRPEGSGAVLYSLDGTTPYEVIPAAVIGTGTPTATPTSATTVAGSDVLGFANLRAAAPAQAVPTWPSGWTVTTSKGAASSGNNPSSSVALRTQATAGSVGGDSVTATSGTNYALYTVATRAYVAPVTPPPVVVDPPVIVIPTGPIPAPTAITAPYAGDMPGLLAQGGQHVAGARLRSASGTLLATLDLEDLRVSFDDYRTPRIKADLTCRTPTTQGLLDQIDPRVGARVEVDLGYVRPGGKRDVKQVADLLLADRSVERPSNRLTLTAYSDERILLDTAPSFGQTFTAQPVTSVMRSLINGAFTTARTINVTVQWPLGEPQVTITDPITDKWSTLQDLADQIGARVYCDGARQWWITPLDQVVGASSCDLKVGPGGTIETASTGLSRGEGFYNRVALDYRWQDASGANKRVTALADAVGPTYGASTGNLVTFLDRRETPTTQAQANAAASSIVARTVTRGRSFTVDAVAAYWLRPGHTVTVLLPLGAQERHLVQAVEFQPLRGLMSVTTRYPETGTTITNPGA